MSGKIIIAAVLLMLVDNIYAQLSGNNYMDYQLGNIPYTDPRDLSSSYDQLNLAYRYKSVKASIRYEHFLSQTEGSSYYRLSQYQLQYLKGKFDVRVGTFNETLGNGLLVRGYDIRGAVLEDQSYRSRYGFYRDMQGVSVKYNGDIWYFNGLMGKSLANDLPPVFPPEERRIDLVEGAETGVSLFKQKLGVIIMRNSNPFEKDLFYSLLASGSLLKFLSYNAEFAHNFGNGADWISLDGSQRYGIYLSMNASLGSFGLSAEYKNYRNLLIGAGISDPPTGVREHKYKVLNRSTHIPRLSDESGFQFEGFYGLDNGSFLTANYTHTKNEISTPYYFDEIFLEYTFYPGSKNSVILFGDYARDDYERENMRFAGGTVWEYGLPGRWSSKVQAEYQFIKRELGAVSKINNGALIIGLSRSPDISFSVTWELSDDPFLNNPSNAPETADQFRHWLGFNGSYKINQANTISIFAGKRRGGPACTSGVCYEVLDFEGFEISLKTKF